MVLTIVTMHHHEADHPTIDVEAQAPSRVMRLGQTLSPADSFRGDRATAIRPIGARTSVETTRRIIMQMGAFRTTMLMRLIPALGTRRSDMILIAARILGTITMALMLVADRRIIMSIVAVGGEEVVVVGILHIEALIPRLSTMKFQSEMWGICNIQQWYSGSREQLAYLGGLR